MKKLILASVMALATFSLVLTPMLRAQDSITIKDPAEFNSYQMATSQQTPAAKAEALESFLETYPNSVVKAAVLDQLIDAYQSMRDADKTLGAASRLLQVDPNNMKAIFISVFIKKNECAKTHDAQTCDDAAVLAQKGLAAPKPAATSDEDWKKLTGATYPVFDSAIAQDDIVSKKDIKAGIEEYRAELMLYPPEQTKSGAGLWDTLQLAEAYTKPGAADPVQAIWFYARAWNYATPIKPRIEADLEYYYKTYHGNLDGLDAVKALAADTVFPPATYAVTPKPTPAQIAHNVVATTPDLTVLNLEDKEYILASGTPDDAAKLWAVMKGQITPVPGIVISATPTVIKVAVTKDAQAAKVADFIVTMKKPLADKEIPAAGFEYGIPPATTLVGTYDSFTQVPATDTTAATAQIMLRDGEIQLKKAAAPRKPAAGHHAGN